MGHNYRYAVWLADESGKPSIWWADESGYADAITRADREALERASYDPDKFTKRLVVVDRETGEVVHDTNGPECACGENDAEFKIVGDPTCELRCAECLIGLDHLTDGVELINVTSGELMTIGALRHTPEYERPCGSEVVRVEGDRAWTADGRRWRIVSDEEYDTLRETAEHHNEL